MAGQHKRPTKPQNLPICRYSLHEHYRANEDGAVGTYETLAAAIDQITEAVANATSIDLATGCSFCGKPRSQLLIPGPGVYVCDECVALYVEIFEEEIGESWREEAEQRLGGENQERTTDG